MYYVCTAYSVGCMLRNLYFASVEKGMTAGF